jgi:hypothetical protein
MGWITAPAGSVVMPGPYTVLALNHVEETGQTFLLLGDGTVAELGKDIDLVMSAVGL